MKLELIGSLTPPSAKILSQIEKAANGVAVEILARPKSKDVPSDALPKFLDMYKSAKKVGSLIKEGPSGKLISEWQALVNDAPEKPELVDMAPAISALLAVKDEEELVSLLQHNLIQRGLNNPLEMDTNSGLFDVNTFEIPCRPQVGVNPGQGVEDHA